MGLYYGCDFRMLVHFEIYSIHQFTNANFFSSQFSWGQNSTLRPQFVSLIQQIVNLCGREITFCHQVNWDDRKFALVKWCIAIKKPEKSSEKKLKNTVSQRSQV